MHGPASHALARKLILTAAAGLLVATAPGCTRAFWRKRTDDDVTGVITQKNVFPDWSVKNWWVYPHPQARFADPFNPDRPPYPPDDYAAKALSPNPQRPKKKWGAGRYEGDGYMKRLAEWDAENRATAPVERKPGEVVPPPKPVEGPQATAGPRGIPGFVAGGTPALTAAPRPAPSVTVVRETPRPDPVVLESRQGGEVAPAGGPVSPAAIIPASAVAQPPQPQPQPPARLPDIPVAPPTGPGSPAPVPGQSQGTGPGPVSPNSPEQNTAAADAANDYLKALQTNECGFRIKLEQAIELGVVNSREFQDRREDLYLAALPVTLQRFAFAAQAFATETAIRESIGRDYPGGPAELWRGNGTLGVGKTFPSGATLLAKIANQFVVDLSGNHPTTAVSNLSLTLAQPFLRGGGYAVTLEPLTQAERTLLYGMRSYARFRKLFYVAVGAGGGYTNNPYGLQGLGTNLGRGVGANLTAPSVGYLPLLLQSAIVSNQRRNITSLEQLLRLYEAFREGGQQSDLQVGQVEIQLLNSRTNLLGSTNANTGGGAGGGGGIRGYLDNLDNFKLQLGVPLTVGLDLDDTPLRPIRRQLARFEEVYAQVREVEEAARVYNPADDVNRFRPRWRQMLTDSPLVRGTPFAREIGGRWAAWEKLTDDQVTARLRELAEERRKILDRRADRQSKGQPEPEAETARLNALEAELDLGGFEQTVRRYEARPWQREQGPAAVTGQAAAFRDVFNAFYQLILEARNDRLADIRRQWPKLPGLNVDGTDVLELPLDEGYTVGMQAALTHRLDLMNARAQVVDAWRQVKVQANALQGVVDVQYNLNSTTPPGGSNPLAFSTTRSDSQLAFNVELPLVRRSERNAYRSALIAYQRQRRNLQAFEDNIANDVRADIRELRTIAELYRFQQRLIELGYSQVDNAQAILLAPPAPGSQNDAGSAAALTQQALQAQQSLLNAQNTLYTIWVNYLVSRMTFYLDLELMHLDDRGLWCDELLPRDDGPTGPGPAPAGPPAERLPAPRPADDRRAR